jgi:hypothetical protein
VAVSAFYDDGNGKYPPMQRDPHRPHLLSEMMANRLPSFLQCLSLINEVLLILLQSNQKHQRQNAPVFAKKDVNKPSFSQYLCGLAATKDF